MAETTEHWPTVHDLVRGIGLVRGLNPFLGKSGEFDTLVYTPGPPERTSGVGVTP